MPLQNVFEIDVDIKSKTAIRPVTVTQNDTVIFIFRISDEGRIYNIQEGTTFTLTSTRPDKQAVMAVGERTGTNIVEFELGTTEIAIPGKVEAVIQVYDAAGRVSTIPFKYGVLSDPSTDYIPSEDEETLIQKVLGEGPQILADAQQATTDANTAATSANNAAQEATEVIQGVAQAVNDAETAATLANEKALLADEKATLANTAAQGAITAKEGAETATQAAQEATQAINLVLPNVEGLEFVEPYNLVTVYAKNNIVSYEGSSFISLVSDNIGNTPTTATNAFWGLLARKGTDGLGSVVTVNGVEPDEFGNVTIPPPDLSDLATKQELTTLDNKVTLHLAESVHVDRYGAKGDGIADDTLPIQNAIDFVDSRGGGTVILGAKTYLVSGITLKDNVTLEGNGKNVTTIKLINGGNSHVIQAGEFDINADGLKRSSPIGCRTGSLRRLSIDGNKVNQTEKKHGLAYYGIDLQLDEVEFKNASGINLYVESPGEVYSVNVDRNLQSSIRHIECHHGNDGNLYYNGQSDSTMIDVVCYETGGNGLGQFNFKFGSKSSGCRVFGIHAWGTSDYGIINEATTAGFTHCHVESATVAKVWIKAPTYFDGRVYQAGAYIEGGANTAPAFLIEPSINSNNIRTTISNCDIAIKFAGADGGSNLFDIQMYSPNVSSVLFSGALSVSNFVRARKTGGSTESIFQAGTGTMRFGTRIATTDVPITGYIEIIDVNGVTRKLAVIG